jgi:hypothetical protein
MANKWMSWSLPHLYHLLMVLRVVSKPLEGDFRTVGAGPKTFSIRYGLVLHYLQVIDRKTRLLSWILVGPKQVVFQAKRQYVVPVPPLIEKIFVYRVAIGPKWFSYFHPM